MTTQSAASAPAGPQPVVALRCRNLVKRFPDVLAVDRLNLEVFRGECFGLLGPNGAGKTTALEILEGLTGADGGEVEVLGQKWGAGHDRALRQRLGVQLQVTQLADKLTVEETVRLFRSFYRHGRTVDDVIAIVGLEEKRNGRVGKLSGGQAQRLALACALVSSPEVLFLDEPTTGLDPQARRAIWDVVSAFKAQGGTVVLTTHYMEEAAILCDRVAVMDHGTLIALDTPAKLVESLGGEQVVEFRSSGALDPDQLSTLPGVRSVSKADTLWMVAVSQAAVSVPALLEHMQAQGYTFETLTTRQATLEDVFLRLTGRRLRDE